MVYYVTLSPIVYCVLRAEGQFKIVAYTDHFSTFI